jgi:PadR family transcriptional regulator PadR
MRGYIDLIILRILRGGDSYGYAISKSATEISQGTYTMKETTLYSAFSRLEKAGHVRSYPGSVTGGRERTYYALTNEGDEYFRFKCDEWTATKELISKFAEGADSNGRN